MASVPWPIKAGRHLREAVKGPEFQKVRSFPVQNNWATHVDVYRLLGPMETPEKVDLPCPVLGPNTRYAVKPIER